MGILIFFHGCEAWDTGTECGLCYRCTVRISCRAPIPPDKSFASLYGAEFNLDQYCETSVPETKLTIHGPSVSRIDPQASDLTFEFHSPWYITRVGPTTVEILPIYSRV